MFHRIWIYLNSMYPPISRMLYAIAHFFGLYFAAQILAGTGPLMITHGSIAGCITVFLFMLYLRVADELKDLEIDLRLFPERALPSGGVNVNDLAVLMGITIVLMFGVNMFYGNAINAFLILFGYGFLMFKFFFYPEVISKSLILSLVTHNPVCILVNSYIIAVFLKDFPEQSFRWEFVLLVLAYWIPMIVWETCRKIRAPVEENDYVTYSKLFGFRTATYVPMAFQCLHFAIVLYLGTYFHYSTYFLIAASLVMILSLAGYVRFLVNPNAKTSKLKPFGEFYMLALFILIIADFIYSHGIQWAIS
ncbi:MAG: prenyltransferase [Proteobacteria bacterium]|nr:MAG: prenyltransferase [Pseudomonadota bacterium]